MCVWQCTAAVAQCQCSHDFQHYFVTSTHRRMVKQARRMSSSSFWGSCETPWLPSASFINVPVPPTASLLAWYLFPHDIRPTHMCPYCVASPHSWESRTSRTRRRLTCRRTSSTAGNSSAANSVSSIPDPASDCRIGCESLTGTVEMHGLTGPGFSHALTLLTVDSITHADNQYFGLFTLFSTSKSIPHDTSPRLQKQEPPPPEALEPGRVSLDLTC
jgi:hypothetical protein